MNQLPLIIVRFGTNARPCLMMMRITEWPFEDITAEAVDFIEAIIRVTPDELSAVSLPDHFLKYILRYTSTPL